MPTEINIEKEPDLDNSIAVAGLPGIGLIGKMAIEYLIEMYEAEKFAEIKSDKFPGWAIRENGLVRDLGVYFYMAEPEELDHALVLVTADAQASSPPGQFELSKEIAEFLSDRGATTALTMAAYLDSEGEKPPVVGAATNSKTAELLDDHGVGLLKDGRIVGMNGLLVSQAGEKGMKGFCLLGTTKTKEKDPEAAKRVLEKFSNIYGLDLDLSEFEERMPELPKFNPPDIDSPQNTGEKKGTSSYIR